MRVAVVVLAGGAARRWGGRDKTAVLLAGRPVLEHAVRGLVAGAGATLADAVVAGPAEHPARAGLPGVRWVREEPPGGGPVAGLAAAVAVLGTDAGLVMVGAGDAPFGGSAVPRLLAAVHEDPDAALALDGAIGTDPGGRDQPLLAVYRLESLRATLAATEPSGARLRDLVDGLRLARVPVDARESLDLDTPGDAETARHLLGLATEGL